MTTKKKIIIAIAIILILSVIAYFIFRKPKEVVEPVITPLNPDGIKQTVIGETFPLKSGVRGENTKRLQMALNKIKPLSPITIDGIFGDQTRLKILTSLSTGIYSQGPEVTESQLNNIITLGNRS